LIYPYKAKNVADKLLKDWDDVCKSLNIPHFIFLGTCLGFHRDKGYIKSDSDIDVGVLCTPQKFAELLKALTKKGIRIGGRLACNINTKRGGVLLDIWFKFGPLHRAYLAKFDTLTYEGRTYNTPSPIEDYLEFTYFNWRTPIPYDAKNKSGVRVGKAKPSACDWPSKGMPVLL